MYLKKRLNIKYYFLSLKDEVMDKCETWYEWLVGKLLYTNPSIRTYELQHHAEQAMATFGGK